MHTSDALIAGNHIVHLMWTGTQDYSCLFSFIAPNHKQKVILRQWKTQKYQWMWTKLLPFLGLKISLSVIKIKQNSKNSGFLMHKNKVLDGIHQGK